MAAHKQSPVSDKTLEDFLAGKSAHTITLFKHFVQQFQEVGAVTLLPAKTMIGIATPRKRIAYITQLGRDFVHVVFMLDKLYPDNLCFQKIGKVPGQNQYNHHFRMYFKEDVNEEVKQFMQLAYDFGS